MFNDLEDIVNSFHDKYKINKFIIDNDINLKCFTIAYKNNQMQLYQSQVYHNFVIIKCIYNYYTSSSIYHIDDIKHIIDPFFEGNLELSYKYCFIPAESFTTPNELFTNIINNYKLIYSLPTIFALINDDLIILEEDNLCYKLPFSNTYINVMFHHCFNNDEYKLYPMLKFLKEQYKCSIKLKGIAGIDLLQKDANEFNISKLIIRLKFDNELFDKEISVRLKNHEHILDILNINQFKINSDDIS